MALFTIYVTRDASVTYKTQVEAHSLDQITSQMGKHGYAGDIIGDWEQAEVSTYDNVERYVVEDSAGNEIFKQDRS
jgi:uncharacterized membrane-anchored protein